MSLEPSCEFCNVSVKPRCRSLVQAYSCNLFKEKNRTIKDTEYKENQMSNTNVKNLVELSQRASRSSVAVIDALSQRGAFKGEEMLTIGQLREQHAQIIRLSETLQSELESSENVTGGSE